jgi:riboflavin biosynthesis pyrimidine reductase
LRANLVDEILLTVEPKIFGPGVPLLAEFAGEARLELREVKRLNAQTILLRYVVPKNATVTLQP